jgi:hypothetical protein
VIVISSGSRGALWDLCSATEGSNSADLASPATRQQTPLLEVEYSSQINAAHTAAMIHPGSLRLTVVALFSLACPLFLTAGTRPASLADTPLAECTPETALGWMYFESVNRQGDNTKQMLRENHDILKIVNALPQSDRPVIELMTPAQAADFSQLSAQLLIHQYNNLAESRLQRDVVVMSYAADAIKKLRHGESELKSKTDPNSEGAGLVVLLRSVSDRVAGNIRVPTEKTCTLDLAMFIKQQQIVASAQKQSGSPEAAQLKELKAKYGLAQLDPSKLPSPDREKAVWLQKAVRESIARDLTAINDWENLRRFVKVSSLRYTIFRDDTIASAGDKNYDYEANLKRAYDRADAPMQRTLDAWAVIDKNIPSEVAQMAKDAVGTQNEKWK